MPHVLAAGAQMQAPEWMWMWCALVRRSLRQQGEYICFWRRNSRSSVQLQPGQPLAPLPGRSLWAVFAAGLGRGAGAAAGGECR
jgi:hypothetical protein